MATNFPTSLDSLTNPTASDKLNSVTVPHASQHADINDAVEALEAKVGVDGSAVTTSHDYLIAKQSVVPYADASARTTAVPSPVEGQMSYLEDTNSVEVYDGSAWAAVGGKIRQVVSTIKTDSFSTTSTSFVDLTGVSVSITPTSASNKVLVMVQGFASKASGLTYLNLVRDSTAIAQSTGDSGPETMMFASPGGTAAISGFGVTYLDSPATTSATTYKLQMRVSSGTGYINRRELDDAYRTVTTITVMEVSA